MKRLFQKKSLWTLLLTLAATGVFGQNILHYQSVLMLAEPKNHSANTCLAIRTFIRDTERMCLLIHPDSITTSIAPAAAFDLTPTDWDYLRVRWAEKPYMKSLEAAKNNDAGLQDAGVVHTEDPDPGISLTSDLCPSRLPLDRRVFQALTEQETWSKKPVSVVLSVSGLWIMTHHGDLAWLKSLQDRHQISIIWANHTLHHHWDKNLPLNENFLLERGTDLSTEVLGNEELMIENGLLPSCFFRFPGLVSDKAIADRIINWGLIPIGSDAWLAKGQHPEASGSIVLIHANGNEPLGVEDFLHLLQQEKSAIQQGRWRILDLREELDKD